IWEQMLGREIVAELAPLRAASPIEFRIPDDLWVRVIYEAAVAYHGRVMPREHLLKALTPLYLGRTATFVLETQGLTSAEAERRVEQLCLAFEERKSYLVDRWSGRPRS
ncbi:MAG: glycosyl transferase family 2, partial [Nitrospira sp.]|nr:glycosyl transferase family 2 [Nitrospira sp.]